MTTFYQIVIYFTLFSFAGWVVETVFCSVKDGHFVYRGFLNGPVTPVYGFGGLIVVYLLTPFQNNVVMLFLAGMVATTILEYITHFLMEKLFHAKWWDYSKVPLNINGRVCLPFSLMFGGLSVAAVHWIYPPFQRMVDRIPMRWQPALAWTFLTLFVTDTVITTVGILRMNGALAAIEKETQALLQRLREMEQMDMPFIDRVDTILHESMSWREAKDSVLAHYAQINAEKEESEEKSKKAESAQRAISAMEETGQSVKEARPRGLNRLQIQRITQAFPRMESTKYGKQLKKLKEQLRDRVEKE